MKNMEAEEYEQIFSYLSDGSYIKVRTYYLFTNIIIMFLYYIIIIPPGKSTTDGNNYSNKKLYYIMIIPPGNSIS